MDDIVSVREAERARHLNGGYAPAQLLAIVESPSKRVLIGAQKAREDLESGFTTVRNVGHSGIDGDTELRDAINAGRLPVPGFWLADANLSREAVTFRTLIPP